MGSEEILSKVDQKKKEQRWSSRQTKNNIIKYGRGIEKQLKELHPLSYQELKVDKSKNSGKCILPKVKEVTI